MSYLIARQPGDHWRHNAQIPIRHRADPRAFIDAMDNRYDPRRIYLDARRSHLFCRSLTVSYFSDSFLVAFLNMHSVILIQGNPLVPQLMYRNGPNRTWTLTPAIREEISQCTSRPCPRHTPFQVDCGQPVSYYHRNGVQENFCLMIGGIRVQTVANNNP